MASTAAPRASTVAQMGQPASENQVLWGTGWGHRVGRKCPGAQLPGWSRFLFCSEQRGSSEQKGTDRDAEFQVLGPGEARWGDFTPAHFDWMPLPSL